MGQSIVRKSVTVDCPQINAERQIMVEIWEISQSGSMAPGYKKKNYDCEDRDNCEYLDDFGRCEGFNRLPHNPHLM